MSVEKLQEWPFKRKEIFSSSAARGRSALMCVGSRTFESMAAGSLLVMSFVTVNVGAQSGDALTHGLDRAAKPGEREIKFQESGVEGQLT